VARQPTRPLAALQLLALAAAAPAGVLLAPTASWDPALLATLAACSIATDLFAAPTATARLKISGSFVAIVLAMVLLGGPPAALIGVATILVGWLRWREQPHELRQNLVTYAWFPLLSGAMFHAARQALDVDRTDPAFSGLVFATFVLALALNFLLAAGYQCWLQGSSLRAKAREAFVPLLPSELFTAALAVSIAYVYVEVGLTGIALLVFVLAAFQHLLRELLRSQRRTAQLASLQLGMMSALLHTLDARDRMTARHSAAVARYAREIARAAGLGEREQELVHTAGLLHDLGKFTFPDTILKAGSPLAPGDRKLVCRHPFQGARIVSQVEGYGPIAEVVLAHHERVDGAGYPRRLRGEQIPALARILSVADVYDVMTARDSYRTPVSSREAVAELQRVAGSQLDARFVKVFVELLEGGELRFRHGEDADFDAELQLEARVHAYAAP
jgi:putative nucleotidyltransferase with HDIG domain